VNKYFQKKDFTIPKKGNAYKVCFNNTLGFKKENYSPEFFYEKKKRAYFVQLDDMALFTKYNPIYELIAEFRGYTLLENFLEYNDVVIDLGAADGLSSIFFSKQVGKNGKILALEPDPAYFNDLLTNITLNNADNVLPIKKALYTHDGIISFQPLAGGASKVEANGKIQVECVTLHTLLREVNIKSQRIKFIKLDVEGAEVELEDDLIEFVKANPNCVIAIASYHEVNGKQTFQILENAKKVHEDIMITTVFPYHLTTYIINKKSRFYQNFKKNILDR